MRYALVGYGRMGRAIDEVAAASGHVRVVVIDPESSDEGVRRTIEPRALDGVDVAFEFTHPGAAESNVAVLLDANVAVVCGTTGWDTSGPVVSAAAQDSEAGAVIAPNFSVGMNLFYALVRESSRMFGAVGGYEPIVFENHHRGKRDAPSGTATRLAHIMQEETDWGVHVGNPDNALAPGMIHVASVRSGSEPGTHTVGFDGEHDVVSLTHRARGRGGFASGAVVAAEWIVGRRGLHGFDAVLEDLLKKGGGR